MNSSQPEAEHPNPSVNFGSNQSSLSVPPVARDGAGPAAPLPLLHSPVRQTTAAVWRRFSTEIRKPAILSFLAIYALLGLLFFFVPEIDLGFSSLFYTPGNGFALGSRSSTIVLPFLPWVTIAFANVLGFLLIRNLVVWRRNRQSTSQSLALRRVLFLLLTLICGPGLIVNVILKEQWGRSRPYRVEAFGGEREFTAAFVTTGSCKSNCSFVSGDAAMGYYLIAFFFIARKRRWTIALAAHALGTALGLVRIAQGAHFLSDVVFSGFFIFLVAWSLAIFLLPSRENPATPFAPRFDRS